MRWSTTADGRAGRWSSEDSIDQGGNMSPVTITKNMPAADGL